MEHALLGHFCDSFSMVCKCKDAKDRDVCGARVGSDMMRRAVTTCWDTRIWDSGTGTCATGTALLGHAILGHFCDTCSQKWLKFLRWYAIIATTVESLREKR